MPELRLSPSQQSALAEAGRRLRKDFGAREVILFGSTARGEADAESDIDLLIITNQPMKRLERHEITDVICEINLKHETNISTVVVDQAAWEHGLVAYTSLRKEIERDGMPL